MTYDLQALSFSEMIHCAAELRGLGVGASSMEDIAERVVRFLYTALVDPQAPTPASACGMVRLYKTHPLGKLSPESRAFAEQSRPGGRLARETVCLSLLATAGEQPAWNTVEASVGHRAIPLAHEDLLWRLPMIAQLVAQLGIDSGAILNVDSALVAESAGDMCNVFFVPDAVGSPHIPAQAEFVVPHGIRSVLGFGGLLQSGELFAVILFSKVPLSSRAPELFKILALSVKIAIAPYSDPTLFSNSAHPRTNDMTDADLENLRLREKLALSEQLLSQLEQVSTGQARRLETLVAELEEQTRVLTATLSNIADGVAVTNEHGEFTHFNPAAEDILGVGKTDSTPDQWTSTYGLFRPDMTTVLPPSEVPLARALAGEIVDKVELFVRNARRPHGVWLDVSARPIRDETGKLNGAVAVFRDVGERKEWERQIEAQLAREKEKNETLAQLRIAVQDLSTPILEIWDDVLALPVIGAVDTARSIDLMERLLHEVEQRQCRFVILDITGVDVIDTATADRLVKLVTAVEMLGARCLLTGARAAVAQTLVALGANLGSVLTLRNLKHGLRECFRAMGETVGQPKGPTSMVRRAGS
jgi:rsbT co-antagonist protein RsbR